MAPQRIAALAALGIIGAGVVGLVVTRDDDSVPTPTASAAPTTDAPTTGVDATSESAGTAREANATDLDDAAGDEAGPDAPVALRYDPELVPDLPVRGEHPPLIGIDGWQQSDIESLEDLRGKVVAVQFWTFGCHNCNATKPHMRALYEKYGGDDFEIVGVHAPEFEYEKDPASIAAAADELGVTWPIALDTEKRSFRSWQTERRFWPRIYLIDREGNIRYDKIGEGRYDEIDAAVGALIDGR
ncbi:MAG: redoxin domain-containing protein [Actinomycetota bacterium]